MRLNDAQQIAAKLPTHVNCELQPHHYKFVEGVYYYTIYGGDESPAAIFSAIQGKMGRQGTERYYTILVPTKRADGTTKPKAEWEAKLMFHKKWARKDIEVKSVSFDIIGYKRKTTQLPSGVLIANIKFIH